ncbi:GlsB/YeaQ/YmgE family stress response membrane protein [Thiomicrospira sp. R3]|uniref:GlsB/YeaQ/YmgE family stress response membrane protein n=1 Tax=Thiomicrospira sp. R3 TaxID=3035472 RepID=UPI00259B532F|nr:GlsB/YeaQ/YmgE family stress response membrane protein [Thiomicrospira sp. R3]WFE69178.1 GlsB/YeaQ/YmgE family stress response membrane protein [Thiomicrospira sp. R3]
MDIINLVVFLAVGALVGWLAGFITKGSGFGIIGNIVVGVVGAVMGGLVFGFFGITTGGLLGGIIMAVIGAVILLSIISIVKKA